MIVWLVNGYVIAAKGILGQKKKTVNQHLIFCVYLPLNGIKKDELAPYFFEEFIHQNKILLNEKLPF